MHYKCISASRIDAALVQEALCMALGRQPMVGLMPHADQGSQ
jgi:hypothetical protein